MGKIFDALENFQISLGDLEREIDKEKGVRVLEQSTKVTREAVVKEEKRLIDLLEINPLMIENINEIEKQIYAIGFYILESMERFVFDSTDLHRRMSNNRRNVIDSEYKVLSRLENGITSSDEIAFRYISIIYQMVYRGDKRIMVDYASSGLVAVIKDPEGSGKLIVIKFKYIKDGIQTLEKAYKLQVSKTECDIN